MSITQYIVQFLVESVMGDLKKLIWGIEIIYKPFSPYVASMVLLYPHKKEKDLFHAITPEAARQTLTH